jgi:hypothetical protein
MSRKSASGLSFQNRRSGNSQSRSKGSANLLLLRQLQSKGLSQFELSHLGRKGTPAE